MHEKTKRTTRNPGIGIIAISLVACWSCATQTAPSADPSGSEQTQGESPERAQGEEPEPAAREQGEATRTARACELQTLELCLWGCEDRGCTEWCAGTGCADEIAAVCQAPQDLGACSKVLGEETCAALMDSKASPRRKFRISLQERREDLPGDARSAVYGLVDHGIGDLSLCLWFQESTALDATLELASDGTVVAVTELLPVQGSDVQSCLVRELSKIRFPAHHASTLGSVEIAIRASLDQGMPSFASVLPSACMGGGSGGGPGGG